MDEEAEGGGPASGKTPSPSPCPGVPPHYVVVESTDTTIKLKKIKM